MITTKCQNAGDFVQRTIPRVETFQIKPSKQSVEWKLQERKKLVDMLYV